MLQGSKDYARAISLELSIKFRFPAGPVRRLLGQLRDGRPQFYAAGDPAAPAMAGGRTQRFAPPQIPRWWLLQEPRWFAATVAIGSVLFMEVLSRESSKWPGCTVAASYGCSGASSSARQREHRFLYRYRVGAGFQPYRYGGYNKGT
jgi:hypothetical protein